MSDQALVSTDHCLKGRCDNAKLQQRPSGSWYCPRCQADYGKDAKERSKSLTVEPSQRDVIDWLGRYELMGREYRREGDMFNPFPGNSLKAYMFSLGWQAEDVAMRKVGS